jgi:two-component system, cell cycle response regulator DivK
LNERRKALRFVHSHMQSWQDGAAESLAPQILIVDDFEDALDIYGQYLTFNGFRVLTARSGAEGVALAREHRPAVIFMDVRMALMTGTEAMQILRTDPEFSATPIVALTAHALEDERDAAMAAGFDEVISKPCLPDDLLTAVHRLIFR